MKKSISVLCLGLVLAGCSTSPTPLSKEAFQRLEKIDAAEQALLVDGLRFERRRFAVREEKVERVRLVAREAPPFIDLEDRRRKNLLAYVQAVRPFESLDKSERKNERVILALRQAFVAEKALSSGVPLEAGEGVISQEKYKEEDEWKSGPASNFQEK